MTILLCCGMRTESAILNNPPGAVVVQGQNGDAGLADQLGAVIAKGGIAGVMSVGVSGGLAPNFRAGDIVMAKGATDGKTVLPASYAWLRDLLRALHSTGFDAQARCGIFGYSTGVVATSAAKAALRTAQNADAVDMETWIAASVAHAHGLPFAAVRTISDPVYFDLPPAALAAMSPTGAIDIEAIIGSLAGDPAQLEALLQLQGYSAKAFDNLAAALLQIGLGLGFPSEVTS